MVNNCAFTMMGVGINNSPWQTSGVVQCEFHDVAKEALRTTFQMLTEGNATYGRPGPCGGPYRIDHLTVERQENVRQK